MKRDQNLIPETYEELYLHYVAGSDSLTNQILRTMLPYEDEETRTDLAEDVFTRLMEHRMIERFDSTKSNFGGVIFFTTRTIVGSFLGKKSRSPLGALNGGSITETVKDEESFEPGTYALDRMFAVQPQDVSLLDAQGAVVRLFKRVANEPKNNRRGRSLGALCKLLMEGNDTKECAQKLGVTPSTIGNWTKYLALLAQ